MNQLNSDEKVCTVCANLAYVLICMYACFSKNLYDFLPYNLKGDVQLDAQAAIFHSVKMDGD